MSDELSQVLTDATVRVMAPYIAAVTAVKLMLIDLVRFLATQPGVDQTSMYEFFRSLPDPPGEALIAELFSIVRTDIVETLSAETR